MTLKTARGTRALIELEDEAPDILFEKLPSESVPLWPTVRTGFMAAMQVHDFASVSVDGLQARTERLRAIYQLGRSFLPSRRDARGLRARRSALYLVGGGTTGIVDGEVRNWLIGDFVDQFPGASAVLQWKGMGEGRPTFRLTRSLEPMVTRAGASARLSPSAVDRSAVNRLVGELASRLDGRITDGQLNSIAAAAAYRASKAPYIEAEFRRVLDRVSPQVVLMEDASYGAWAPLISLMKERGILVVEPQHGWIGPTHGAYNFGAAMRQPELFATLPDELLTFGEYWSEGIRHPATQIAIGKPHLEGMASRAPAWEKRPYEVVLVSSVANPGETIDFGLALRAALPRQWSIRFRPHPIERPSAESRYARMLGDPGIVLDKYSDVYESLSSARGVVGVASTVLFEALEMGCRVFVRDSVYTDYYVGDMFGPTIHGVQDVDRIARGLAEGSIQPGSPDVNALWRPDAIANFRAWARGRLGEDQLEPRVD